MVQLIAERPLLLALLLGVLAAALIYGWLQSGRKPLALGGLGIACLIPILWIISEYWVTDREQIQQLMYETAAAVQANDHEAALAVIGDERTRDRAAAELPQWVFSEAAIGSIRSIRIIEDSYPLQADVDAIVKIELRSKRGGNQSFRLPRRLLLTFEKRGAPDSPGGGWVVTHYQHLPLVGGPDGFSN